MNQVREIEKINQREQELGIEVGAGSWHDEYADSAYVFLGGLSPDMTEGDVLTVASQFGTVIDVNLVRDKETGKSRGFAFVGYRDQRSTVLAVDNFTGATLLKRTLRCDHVPSYRIPGKRRRAPERGAAALSSSEESSTDSERELYTGTSDGLTPLQRRMIRARVKRQLAREAGEDVSVSDDAERRAADARGGAQYAHAFYAVERERKRKRKRRHSSKKESSDAVDDGEGEAKEDGQVDGDAETGKAKKERRRRHKRSSSSRSSKKEFAKRQEEEEAEEGVAKKPTPTAGGTANPFLAKALAQMQAKERAEQQQQKKEQEQYR